MANVKLIFGLICIVSALYFENVDCQHIWGDLTTKIILGSSKAKFGIPFITRTVEVSYPNVNSINFFIKFICSFPFRFMENLIYLLI